MSKLDQMIEEALDAEDRALFSKHAEPGLFGETAALFAGKLGPWNMLSAAMQVILFAGALYSGRAFLAAGDASDMMRWGGLCLLLMIAMSVIKLMHWAQMQANRVIREVKRMELLLARAKAA